MALWFEGRLYALAVGRASRRKHNVTVHFLEREYDNNPFAEFVTLVVLDVADNFGKIIGAETVRIRDPVDGMIGRYERLGFALAQTLRGSTYYERRIS